MGFTRENLRDIRNRIEGAIHSELAEFKGLNAKLGRIRFTGGQFTVRLEVTIPEGEKQKNEHLDSVLKTLGIDRIIPTYNGVMEVVDYVPRRPRYPFTYTINGKRMKCSANLLKDRMLVSKTLKEGSSNANS